MNQEEKSALIKKSERIALVLPKTLGSESVSVAASFAAFLKKEKKSYAVFSETSIPDMWKCVPLKNLQTETKTSYALVFNAEKHPIKEIGYEKDPDKKTFSIILTPESGQLKKEDITLIGRETLFSPDLTIIIGGESVASVGSVWKKHPELFYEKTILLFGSGESSVSLAEECASTLKKISPRYLDPEIATALLFALFSKTECLQSSDTTDAELLLASELLAAGANHQMVAEELSKKDSVPLLQLWGRACVRSKLDREPNIFWSFLTADDFIKTGTTPARALSYVLERMEKVFSSTLISVFLWQDPETKKVRPKIVSRELRHSSIPVKEYDSFLSAESDIRELLQSAA